MICFCFFWVAAGWKIREKHSIGTQSSYLAKWKSWRTTRSGFCENGISGENEEWNNACFESIPARIGHGNWWLPNGRENKGLESFWWNSQQLLLWWLLSLNGCNWQGRLAKYASNHSSACNVGQCARSYLRLLTQLKIDKKLWRSPYSFITYRIINEKKLIISHSLDTAVFEKSLFGVLFL